MPGHARPTQRSIQGYCLACRDYARAEYLTWAGIAEVAARAAEEGPRAAQAAKATPTEFRAEERTYRGLAARFGGAS